MFLGEYSHTLDAKGRLIIPSKYREELGEKAVVTNGPDGSIDIYPESVWNELSQRPMNMSRSDLKQRTFRRLYFGGAIDVSVDKQGRTVIPIKYLQQAGVAKDITIFGSGDFIEVWSTDRWNDFIKSQNLSYEELLEELNPL